MQGGSAVVKGYGGMLGSGGEEETEGIEDAQDAHDRLVGEDGEVEKGNDNILLGCRRVVMVVDEASNKERHDISIDKGGAHLRILLR